MPSPFSMAHRRVLLKAWWDLVGAAMKDGRTRARAIEQKLYVERNMTVQV